MISSFFQEMLGAGTAFATWFVELIETLLGLFYVPGADGAFGSFTILGCFALIGLVIFLFRIVLKFIMRFFNR